MTLFNHFKYHFTQGISIPSRAAEKTKAHQVRPLREQFAGWQPGTSHARNRGFSGRGRARLFWCETAKWGEMKESGFITVKSHWIWLLLSAQRRVSLLWFMMCSRICNTSFEPWFWYDQVIPRDGSDQRLNFLLVWYFNVKTICRNRFISAFLQADHPPE